MNNRPYIKLTDNNKLLINQYAPILEVDASYMIEVLAKPVVDYNVNIIGAFEQLTMATRLDTLLRLEHLLIDPEDVS